MKCTSALEKHLTSKVYLFDLCNLEDDHIFSRSSQRVEKPKTFF